MVDRKKLLFTPLLLVENNVYFQQNRFFSQNYAKTPFFVYFWTFFMFEDKTSTFVTKMPNLARSVRRPAGLSTQGHVSWTSRGQDWTWRPRPNHLTGLLPCLVLMNISKSGPFSSDCFGLRIKSNKLVWSGKPETSVYVETRWKSLRKIHLREKVPLSVYQKELKVFRQKGKTLLRFKVCHFHRIIAIA